MFSHVLERCKKSFAYPCTSLWPLKVVKRYVHFINITTDKISELFQAYENNGGEYYGNGEDEDEDVPDEDGDVTEVEEESSDVDDVF